jgi:MobA/MobL family
VAIFHLSAGIHSRGKGHSAIAGAAYRARDAITDERTGERPDYSRKSAELLFAGIYAPKDAPAWAQDRAQLWNHVEAFEKRSDAQLCRVFDIALPHELTLEQNRWLLQDWVRENFTRKELIADVAIHAPHASRGNDNPNVHVSADPRNIHAHVAVVLRKLDGTEFAAKKERTTTNEERLAELEGWRASWEKLANRHLERAGVEARIDRRTLKEQGIDREPTIHLGPAATRMEREEPGSSERGNVNREVADRNATRTLEAEARSLGAEIIDLAAERAMREARAAAQGRADDTRPDRNAGIEAGASPPANQNIDAEAERAMQDARAAAQGRTDDVRAEMREAAQETTQRAEPETIFPASTEMMPEVAPLTGHEIRSIGSILGGILDSIAKPFENLIAGLADIFSPPPPMTQDQAERAERAAEENREASAEQAAQQERSDNIDRLVAEMQKRQQEEDFAARYGTPGGSRDRDRDDDYDRGREREM